MINKIEKRIQKIEKDISEIKYKIDNDVDKKIEDNVYWYLDITGGMTISYSTDETQDEIALRLEKEALSRIICKGHREKEKMSWSQYKHKSLGNYFLTRAEAKEAADYLISYLQNIQRKL